jgi:hypothetical protein
MALWTNKALAIGREFEVTIKLGAFTLSRRARIVHSCKDNTRWVTGLTFVARRGDDGKIDELIKLMATEFRAQ